MAGKANNLNSEACHSNIIDSSDSESDSKSDISFLAVPEQFRPSAITRKSPLPKSSSESIRIENKISNNPSESKPLSYSKQPDEIPMQKDAVTGSLEKSSTKHEKPSFRDKSPPPETILLPLLQKEIFFKETEQTGNELSDEDIDEPIRCRNTKRISNVSGIMIKQRMPNQDIHENRRKSRNTTGPSRESENTTTSETCEKKITESNEKDDPISIIEIDVANLPPMKEMKQYSKNRENRVKYEIMPGKEQNCTTLSKRNPINKKYRKKFQSNQISFSIQKQKNIRWDSDLNLNALNQNLYSSTSQKIGKTWLKSENDTIEWTVVRQEKTFIAARKLDGKNMNNCHQTENMKAAYSSKSLFKAEENSSDDETNTDFAKCGIGKNVPKTIQKTSNPEFDFYDDKSKVCDNNLKERKNNVALMSIQAGRKNSAMSGIRKNEPKTISKTSNRQHVSSNSKSKACNTQTVVHKNNQKGKNILMSIRASCAGDCRNSESFEKSQNKVEYDCCKDYSTTYDEYELSEEDHCCACEISKSSNEMNKSDRELPRDQIINKNFKEKNLHRRSLLNNKQDSVSQIGKMELKSIWNCETGNYEKPENLGKSCWENEGKYYEQHGTSEENVLSKASYDTKELLGSSKKANIKSQKQNFNQFRSVNSCQSNLCQQNIDSNNKDSYFPKEESKDGKLDHCEVAEENINSILQFGREISDLIIGCHIALSAFFSIYNEWSLLRRRLIEQFEQLAENINDSSSKYEKYSDILKAVNIGAEAAGAIPHPAVAMAAKIVSTISGLLSALIKTSKSDAADVEEPAITTSLFEDINLSSLLYMYGVQCNQQFEETIKCIEEYLPNTSFQGFSASEDADMANFLQGVSEYTPKHRIFYKKLYKCFQELIRKCSSSFSRRFCEPFLLYESDSVDVIEYLDWRFAPDFNNESVKHELEEINRLIESKSTSMKDLLSRIRNCVRILKDEISYVERSVTKVSMFNNSFGTSKKN